MPVHTYTNWNQRPSDEFEDVDINKWVGTLIGFPILAAIISGVITLLT